MNTHKMYARPLIIFWGQGSLIMILIITISSWLCISYGTSVLNFVKFFHRKHVWTYSSIKESLHLPDNLVRLDNWLTKNTH